MLSPAAVESAAMALHEAECSGRQIPALTRAYPAMDMNDAYAVQRRWVEHKLALGRRIVGYKIGLNSRAMQMALNIDAPAFELIGARSYRVDPETGYTRTVFDTIADNAANAGVVLGDRRIEPGEVDLRWAGAVLYLNGTVEETGLGAGVMDHPAHGVRWVCKRFAAHGVGLEPGQVILSGSFTRPVKVSAGDSVKADFGALGSVELEFT